MVEKQRPQMFISEGATPEQRDALAAFEDVASGFDGDQILAALNIAGRGPETVGDVVTLFTVPEQRDRTQTLLEACQRVFDTGAYEAVDEYDESTQWSIELDRSYQESVAAYRSPAPVLGDSSKHEARRMEYRREMARIAFEVFAGRHIRSEVEVSKPPKPDDRPWDRTGTE